ncbi:laminin subunit beta-1-like [Pocillopora damicornis]|uniref:laminin subunit beta-1-like n=1 Tax=Pocillopora damicornis TaxID=46731 RepID=UPI000F553BBB|nr:laminin subunit beta-1-like [Pocillopora damicornis]
MRQVWGRSVWQLRSNCTTSNLLVVLCLFAIFSAVSGQDSCSVGPCYPSPSDISKYFNVTANSTCGNPSEPYCVNLDCTNVCNAFDDNLAHNASLVKDDFSKNTFWKSKNYEFPVVLQLEVRRTFMLYQSVVTFYHELPAAMYLLKSNDSGRTWNPLTYFATNCTKYFNLPETPENEREGLKIQCFKIDTANKQLFYTPMQDPAAALNLLTDTEKQAFFLMTDIKMVLVKFIIPGGVETLTDSLKRSFFFTVSDWDVLASCFCNGQASKCDPDDFSKCICERNTDGPNCEKCLPLYNNKPYQIREACEACECNSHSDSCSYNETKGYGICNDCKHNTTGDMCQLCKETFYRNSAVSQNTTNTCLACACHVPGVNTSADSSQCDSVTGQCACKSRVMGRACDMCRDTYWKLTTDNEAGCEECHCNLTGTVNSSNVCDKITGQCPCKQLLTGRTCNQCQDGYFGLTSENPGCTACNCDLAGSVNTSCSSSGKCYCRPKFSGDKCDKIDEGFFVPSVDFMTFQAEDATPITVRSVNLYSACCYLSKSMKPQTKTISHREIVNAAGNIVLVVGVVLNEGVNNAAPTELEFTVNIPKTGFFNFVLRYMTGYNWNLVKITALLRTAFVPFTCNNINQITKNEPLILTRTVLSGSEAHDYGSHCLLVGQYSVKLQIPAGSAQQGVLVTRRKRRALPDADITVDSLLAMPTVSEYDVFKEASAEVQENMTFYYNASSSLKTWSANSEAGSRALAPVFGSTFGEGQACNCSSVGSNDPDECDRYSGQCSCKPNVIGRTCDQCRPDYFNFTSGQGCQDCNCSMTGANETSCHPETGQCSCRENVIGQHCEQCEINYYNFNSGAGCSSCDCNPIYSTSLQCDGNTGVCSCKPGINGAKCTGCADQFYNLTDQGCMSCDCNLAGSASPACNKTTGQCPCKAQSLGRQCDMCPAGYYGLSVQNPQGCLKCQCSNKSSECVADPGWFVSTLNTTLSVFNDNVDLDGWSTIDSAGKQVNPVLDWDVTVNIEKGSMKVDTQGSDDIYFVAPDKYLGDKRSAYTYALSFHLQQDNASSPATSSRGDVILEGKWFDEPLVSSLDAAPPGGDNFRKYEVKLVESNWRVGNTSGRQPSSYEMIVVLSHLTSLRIRAKWTTLTTKLFTRLADIELTLSSRSNIIPGAESALNIENCSCPVEYKGQFCEQCASGYTRVTPNGGPYVTCVPCECNGHSDMCDPETGVCLDCQHNTTGDHCEKCLDGWYGNATNATPNDCSPCPCPSGPFAVNQFAKTVLVMPTVSEYNVFKEASAEVQENMTFYYNASSSLKTWSANSEAGSRALAPVFGSIFGEGQACNCSSVGSNNPDECDRYGGLCSCKPNVIGHTCNQCRPDYFNFTSGQDYKDCNCNMTGANCDMCPAGYYGLSVQNPQGCLKCQCSNKSSDCVTDPGWFFSTLDTPLSVFNDNVDLDGWSTIESAGKQVNPVLDWDITINIEKGSIRVDTQGSDDIYFVAPDKYLGDKRSAYTNALSFHLQQDNASSPATSSNGDVILEGKWFDEPLVSSLDAAPPGGDNFRKYEVKLVENNWRVGNTSGRQPSSYEIIVVLSHLTSLRIRAKWTTLTTKLFTRLADIKLTLSNRSSVIPGAKSALNIENCSCPVEYKGQFCEQCANGYTRVTPKGGPYVTCVPCECNGHSDKCDTETGVCLDCQHNTTGEDCEKCLDGWYGNATNATLTDCSPCPCPSGPFAVNQFAKTCVLSSDGLPTCVNCTVGHEGRYCERCVDGYFGRPKEQDSQCHKCNCNNNIDPAATGNCNTTTGECLKCLYNTTGSNCQWCAPGYHGNALNKTCTRCNCSAVFSLNNECDNMTGSCYCHPYVTGKFCDRCEQNAFNYTASGCLPCNCNNDGSVDLQCDSIHGNCSCKPNVIGKKCNICTAGLFDVQKGCLACNCSTVGSKIPDQCDRNSGQCSCKPNVIGRTCDQCRPDYFNFASGQGCQACACFLPGVNTSAHSALCDRDTGQCFCNSGVLGRTCDMCRNPSMKLGSASEVGCVGMLL